MKTMLEKSLAIGFALATTAAAAAAIIIIFYRFILGV